MWYPLQGVSEEVVNLILAALNNEKVKAELSKQIRVQMDNEKTKQHNGYGKVQSYDSLTSGNVNLQAKMAASGYDVYGRTIIGSNSDASNQNIYKKMKNNIKYGKNPTESNRNKGSRSIF